MNSGFVALGPHRLHFLKFGKGPRLVLAFHGYSNSAGLFLPFERALETDCTVVSIDLPHHGRSTDWPESRALKPEDLIHLVKFFCDEHGVEKCRLLGFSLGGRVSLKIIEAVPQRIAGAVLAAPDGLRFSPFHYFVTRTAAGRGVFSDVLTRPQRYFRVLDALKRRGVLSDARHQFAKYYLESSHSRGLLRKAWPSLRFLIPRPARVKAAIAAHNIPVHIFAGRYDRVIPLSGATSFARGMPQVKLRVLEKGHRVIESDTLGSMAATLLE